MDIARRTAPPKVPPVEIGEVSIKIGIARIAGGRNLCYNEYDPYKRDRKTKERTKMKAVIWIVTIVCVAMITTLCRTNGIILGAIPTAALYGGAVAVARTLSNAIDRKKAEGSAENTQDPA